MSRRRAFLLLALSAASSAAASLGCAPTPPPVAAPRAVSATSVPAAALAPPTPPPPDPARFHALLVNGGGSPNINYQPHLAALASLREVLLHAGIPPTQVDVLSSDGDDPAPDLTVLATETPEDRWLLDGTRLERSLGSPLQLVSSALPGATLGPATKAGLSAWFDGRGKALRAGDTLLFFVTDHGTKGPAGPETNAITLWGPEQSITVSEVSSLLAKLAPGVRVVSLMSQCFSGGFAGLSAHNQAGAAGPTVCGYFSSTADRPAYGCFPENIGDDTVGHAHDFARALAATHSMAEAHRAVVRLDVTPDVPLRTSDLELERLVRATASRDATPLWTTVARLLGPGWREQPALRGEVAELDALAASFGLPVPVELDGLPPLDARLSTLERETATSAKVWRSAFSDATNANLDAFLVASPSWSPRVAETAIPALTPPLRAALGGALVSELEGFLKTRPNERLDTLHGRASASSDTAYRMAVRRAVLLRVQSRLMALAGRALLASGAAESERAAYETLLACEDVVLPGTPRPGAEGPPPPARPPLPSLDADEAAHRAARPAWIGIAFNDTPVGLARQSGRSPGGRHPVRRRRTALRRAAGHPHLDHAPARGDARAARRPARRAETDTHHRAEDAARRRQSAAAPAVAVRGRDGPHVPAPALSRRHHRGQAAPLLLLGHLVQTLQSRGARAPGLRTRHEDADRGHHRRRAGRARRLLQDLRPAFPEGGGDRRAAPRLRRVRRVGHAHVRADRRQGRRALAQSGLFPGHRHRRRLEVGRQVSPGRV